MYDPPLCDPQIVALSLGVLCVCFMYVCKFPREAGYIPRVGLINNLKFKIELIL